MKALDEACMAYYANREVNTKKDIISTHPRIREMLGGNRGGKMKIVALMISVICLAGCEKPPEPTSFIKQTAELDSYLDCIYTVRSGLWYCPDKTFDAFSCIVEKYKSSNVLSGEIENTKRLHRIYLSPFKVELDRVIKEKTCEPK